MQFTGTLKSWNDDRGFGFIEPDQGGQEMFVHIKSFPSGTGRPSVGQALVFEVELRPNGKKQAHSVQYPVRARGRPAQRVETPARWTAARVCAVPMFAALYAYVIWCWGFRPPMLFIYGGMSIVAFVAYGIDKAAALSGRRRISENALHLLALAGGWPGALLAQQIFRHKTSKHRFIVGFWLTVMLNVALFFAWHAGVPSLAAFLFTA